MRTLGDLGLRKFTQKDEKLTVSRAECPTAVALTPEEYRSSKSPNSGSSRILPYSPTQVLDDIMMIGLKEEKALDNFYVYRDHLRYDGYVDNLGRSSNRLPQVTPDLPLSEMVFERVIGVLNLLPGDDINYKMAIKYEPGKLQVGFGANVKICSNWTIFNAKLFDLSKFEDYDKFLDNLGDHLIQIEEHFQTDLNTIHLLDEHEVTITDVQESLGDLLLRYNGDSPVLNMTDISAAATRVYTEHQDGKMKSAWDFLNATNYGLKFDTDSGNSILERIQAISDYTQTKFLN